MKLEERLACKALFLFFEVTVNFLQIFKHHVRL